MAPKNQKVRLDQMLTKDIAEEIIEAFHEPLGKVLEPRGDKRHFLGSYTAKQYNYDSGKPHHQH